MIIQLQQLAGFCRALVGDHFLDQWVAGKFNGDAGILVQLDLERKDHCHLVDDAAHFVDAFWAPRPDLRADVEQHLDADRFGVGGQALVKLLIVDQDQQIWPVVVEHAFELVECSLDFAVVG